jgi:hypothetical protein
MGRASDTHRLAADPRSRAVFRGSTNKRYCSIRVEGVLGGLGGQETCVELICGSHDLVGLRSEDAGGVALNGGRF